jgi:hypothetical protein
MNPKDHQKISIESGRDIGSVAHPMTRFVWNFRNETTF